MSAVWDTLLPNQRQYLGELSAGEQNCPNMQKCIYRMTLTAGNPLETNYYNVHMKYSAA